MSSFALNIHACGPLWRIDGPRPVPPVFGLLQAADAPAAGVTLVTDVDGRGIERWANGVQTYSYPSGESAGVWAPYAPASERVNKGDGETLPSPQFDPMTVYVAELCSAQNVVDQDAFKARASLALDAVQGAMIAREFMRGTVLTLNPFLADGNGIYPGPGVGGNTATTPTLALALLEDTIAQFGELGVIHMSPAMATILGQSYILDSSSGVLRTKVGTVVIPDQGYRGSANPLGKTASKGREQWIFATGPIEIRLSEMIMVPDNLEDAMTRGTGAAGSTPNSIEYRAERYAMVTWDTNLQAAVRADMCLTTCT